MSNWCMGCGREIPNGDYCSICRALGNDNPYEYYGDQWEEKYAYTAWLIPYIQDDVIPF